jgi:small subunit ribosomal protein S20
MANIASVAKRARQAVKRTERNSALKASLRTAKKKMAKLLTEGNQEAISAALPATLRLFDKMVSKNIIHKNTAARNKSRLMVRVNQLSAAKQS